VAIALASPLRVLSHGGEEHSHPEDQAQPTAAVAGMQGDVLTSSATTDYFEIVAKYPATGAGEETPLRLFVADYATNAPIANAALSLAFRPAGVVVRKAPKMVSPGIYDLAVTFPEDTVYALVATVTAGQRTDFVEVRNLYAGDAAETFLAEHGAPTATAPAESTSSWMLPAAIVAALALATIVIVMARRRRRPAGSQEASVARDPELSVRSESDAVADHPNPDTR
jgi:hypothetical protein